MGIIINQRAAHINFPDLLDRLNIKVSNSDDGIPNEICRALFTRADPSETGRGFVLHSPDYFATASTLTIDEGIVYRHRRHPEGHR